MKSIYLDYNATAPVRPESTARMQALLATPLNASSAHSFGREAKKTLEDARKIIADSVSAWPNEIIFTGSGTEANTTALRGIHERKLLVGATEHSSVLKVSHDAKLIPVNSDGIINLGTLDMLLSASGPAIVSVMLANNETGVIQPLRDISELCKKHDALLHTDAVQALGKIPVDFGALGVDMMTLAGHKCGGPLGAAALVVRKDLPIKALLSGGGQELNRRAGTENIAAIGGFATAVEKFDFTQMKNLCDWRDAMEKDMESLGATVFGKKSERLPNTSCVAMPGVGNEVQLMDFDLKGFAVSAGSACSSGRIEVSHVLLAMGVDKNLAANAIRISGGWQTTQAELVKVLDVWKQMCARLSKKAG